MLGDKLVWLPPRKGESQVVWHRSGHSWGWSAEGGRRSLGRILSLSAGSRLGGCGAQSPPGPHPSSPGGPPHWPTALLLPSRLGPWGSLLPLPGSQPQRHTT